MSYDVPFATQPWDEIIPGLWQGCHHYADPDRPWRIKRAVVDHEFDLVVSLYGDWGYGPPKDVQEIRALVPDGPLNGEDMAKVTALVPPIREALTAGKNVLVRCQAGYNRSGLVIGLVLLSMGATAEEAIGLIREKRPPHALCNPHFVEILRQYGGEVAT